jgi:hypothetical protein
VVSADHSHKSGCLDAKLNLRDVPDILAWQYSVCFCMLLMKHKERSWAEARLVKLGEFFMTSSCDDIQQGWKGGQVQYNFGTSPARMLT